MVMLKTREKSPFYINGLYFSCSRCSACCRYESGYVFLSKKDMSGLAAALNMKNNEFIETYCRWIPSSNSAYQLALKEKSNYDCIFWSNTLSTEFQPESPVKGGCSVYQARPLQCRAFPFWSSVVCDIKSWNFTAGDCPGMGRGNLHTRDSIEKWLALRQNEPIMTKGDS